MRPLRIAMLAGGAWVAAAVSYGNARSGLKWNELLNARPLRKKSEIIQCSINAEAMGTRMGAWRLMFPAAEPFARLAAFRFPHQTGWKLHEERFQNKKTCAIACERDVS